MHDSGMPMGRNAPANPAPTSAAALAAGLLAVLGALAALFTVGDAIDGYFSTRGKFAMPDWFLTHVAVVGVVSLCSAVLLMTGAIKLMRRNAGARWIVFAGCLLVVLLSGYRHVIAATTGESGYVTVLDAATAPSSLFLLPFPFITAILALLPSTRRWCTKHSR